MSQSNVLIRRIIILIILVAIVEQFASDCYLPSFPEIAKYFVVSHSFIQLSLTVFFTGMAISQFIFGSLSDRYGRRSMLILGLVIFAFSSLICVIAKDVKIFWLGRLLQGFGVGSGLVIARAVGRDLFQDVKFAQMTSSLGALIVLMQLLSPVVGGYIQHYLGWRAVFILITVLAFILLASVFLWMPETLSIGNRSQRERSNTINSYLILLKSKVFLTNVLYASLVYSMATVYITVAPFLYQHVMNLSPIFFGWITALVGMSMAIGSILNSKLVARLGLNRMIQIGLTLILTMLSVVLLMGVLQIFNVWCIVIPIFFVIMGIGFITANVGTKALTPFPAIAGSAAAIYGGIQFSTASLFSAIASLFQVKNLSVLALLLLTPILMIGIIKFFFKEKTINEAAMNAQG